jgi:hypothetical protein
MYESVAIKNRGDNSNKGSRGLLTLGDKLLMGGILVLSLFSFFAVSSIRKTGRYVVVEVDGVESHRLNLKETHTLEVEGPIGKTVIKINNGQARVISSDCPHKLCVRSGAISRAGDLIVCVPNKVVVRIEGEEIGKWDVITE